MSRHWNSDVEWRVDLVTPSAEEPLELAFVRDLHLRVANGAAEDLRIESWIRTARRQGEAFTGRAFQPRQRWHLVMNRFPSCVIQLPRPPLIEVAEIAYYDEDNALQTVDEANYLVDAPVGPYAKPGTVTPISTFEWPATYWRRPNAVTVKFDAGYLDTSVSPEEANVPEDLKDGMCLVIGELYKQRSESVHGFGVGQSPALLRARQLWWPYRYEVL